MASISNTPGVTDSALVGQVSETTRPDREKESASSASHTQELPRPKGVKELTQEKENAPGRRLQATLRETEEVAQKLQDRIDEVAKDPHQVAISTDEHTRASVIQIKDPNGKVLKQFPPEKVLNLHQRLDDLSGMVIDEMI